MVQSRRQLLQCITHKQLLYSTLNHALDEVCPHRALHCVLHVVHSQSYYTVCFSMFCMWHVVHSHETPHTPRYLTQILVSYLHEVLLYYIKSCVNKMTVTTNHLLLWHISTCIGHLQVTVEHTERFLVAYCSYMTMWCGMCTQIQHLNDNHTITKNPILNTIIT